MNKPRLLALAVLLAICVSCSSSNTGAQQKEPVLGASAAEILQHTPRLADHENTAYLSESMGSASAFDYFRDEEIYSGWNMGNSLDSYSGDGVGGETNWGNPQANQELMNGVKAAGFDIIRIPVTWMGYIGASPDYRVNRSRLERTAQVVEMAHNAGLKVIINLHHDGSTSSESREEGWLSIRKASRNPNDYVDITRRFGRTWLQIAKYFRNYGDWLLFESFNELHDGGWGGSDAFRSNPRAQLNIINEWNQLFTDIVRGSGGNNETRYLVIPAYCTQPKQTLADTFILPVDPVPGKQVVTFHYYDPYEFGIQGVRTNWGTDADKARTDSDFAPFKPKFIDNNIPVIIGECGAVRQLYPNDKAREELASENRLQYLSHIFGTAGKYDLVPIYWDNGSVSGNGEKFGLFDRRTGQPHPNVPESETLISAMVNAVK